MSWTPEKTQKAIELASKKKTAREIAKEIGMTRNAVIAKLNRIRVPLKIKKYITVRKNGVGYIVIERPKAEAKKLNKELFENPQEDSIHFLDLTRTTCRWPVSEDNKIYCGKYTESTYCDFHSRIAYTGKK